MAGLAGDLSRYSCAKRKYIFCIINTISLNLMKHQMRIIQVASFKRCDISIDVLEDFNLNFTQVYLTFQVKLSYLIDLQRIPCDIGQNQ